MKLRAGSYDIKYRMGGGTRSLITNEARGIHDPLIDFGIRSLWDDVLLMGFLSVRRGNSC